MAVNQSRSQNANLAEGMSDGKYKKAVMDRGGEIESTTYNGRRDLSDQYYGIHEARSKVLGDGTQGVTPSFVATPPVHIP